MIVMMSTRPDVSGPLISLLPPGGVRAASDGRSFREKQGRTPLAEALVYLPPSECPFRN
jgi:hypothetical protein